MLALDEKKQRQDRLRQKIEAEREKAVRFVAQTYQDAVYLLPGESAASVERQWGRGMTSAALEETIRRVCGPNFLFVHDPKNLSNKWVWLRLPNGNTKYLLTYHFPVMPEYSVIKEKEETIPDFAQMLDKKNLKIKDLPQGREQVLRGALENYLKGPQETYWENGEWITAPKADETTLDLLDQIMQDDDDPDPGFVTAKIPWGEQIRGWRTVLARLVEMGFASPERIERLVGGSQRASWAAHLGKQQVATPW